MERSVFVRSDSFEDLSERNVKYDAALHGGHCFFRSFWGADQLLKARSIESVNSHQGVALRLYIAFGEQFLEIGQSRTSR